MGIIKTIIILLFLWAGLPVSAQDNTDVLRHLRYNRIDYYHFNAGVEAGMNQNTYAGINMAVGLGSVRNLLGADIGIRYAMCNPVRMGSGEYLSASHVTLFVSGSLNVLRWREGSAFVGAEAACNFGVSSTHHGVSHHIQQDEKDFHETFGSLRGMLGVRLSRLNVSAYCQYNLAPQMNQKYIFETETFDYDLLHDKLFERLHFGLSIAYSLPL